MIEDGFQDWYAELGVSPEASSEEIRQAWRRQAHRNHPDRRGGDADRFVRARRAFETLVDPALRHAFDEKRRAWLLRNQSQSAMMPAASAFSFRQWWQDARQARRPSSSLPQGDRASVLLRIPLARVFSESEHVVRLRVARTCQACQGARAQCAVCGGTGQRLVPGAWQVMVPAGTVDGTVLRLAGQGHQGPRFGSPGDVLVTVVWTHRGIWRWRRGRLVGSIKVSRRQLVSGARIRLRTPQGAWGWLELAPGLDQARLVRLPGLGLPDATGHRADAFIECYPGGKT